MATIVPVIDIAAFQSGDERMKRRVAAAVNRACKDIGFFVITGHGVDPNLCENAFRAAAEFFSLPLEEKLKWKRWSENVGRGYAPVGRESSAYSMLNKTPGDLKETFSMGPVDVPADDDYYHCAAAGNHFAENRWPDRPAAFGASFSEYYRRMEKLAPLMMRIFALALELPEDYFEHKIDKHMSSMRVLNYPEQHEEPLPGQLRASEHSDFDTFTILRHGDAGMAGGLQVHNRDGEWIDVPAIADSFVINLGDMMQRWTNDRWVSTPHRVINPPLAEALISRRMSIAFFHETNYDTIIECLPNCSGAGNPVRYPAVTCGEYVQERLTRQGSFHRIAQEEAIAARPG